MSGPIGEPAFSEVADWNLFDVHVRVGRSAIHAELAIDSTDLLAEMDRFCIRRALVSHFAAEEYDATEGNSALACELNERLTPAWAALPDREFLEKLRARRPRAVRLCYGARKHNFSSSRWCSGEMHDYLQQHSIVTLIAREEITWNDLARLVESFPRLPIVLLETGYRADRYLFPLVRQHPNLYVDTSTYVSYRQLENFVDRLGPDHLVFGSRLPLYTPGAALAVLATARISEEAKRLIAGGTLRRLLSEGGL